MAVVQISRIQVRRGKKNEGSGLPQLASGEFGWAVDSQELYIGNGSVAEGAPQVGNTRILTANDNIFDFATQYTFRANEEEDIVQTGLEPNLPVIRSVQARLDETVSVASFGVFGDSRVLYSYNNPTEDVTVKLQHAIDQLYISTVAKQSLTQRIKLFIPAGHYTLTDTIYIPPFVSLVGEGVDKTIIHSRAQMAFRTVDGDSVYINDAVNYFHIGVPGYNGSLDSQAKNINISNFTLDLENPNAEAFRLESVRDSHFSNLKIQGTWTVSNGYSGSAFNITQKNNIVESNNNTFENIEVFNLAIGVYSDYDIKYNIFDNMRFTETGYGFWFGNSLQPVDGQRTGPEYSVIKNSLMQNVINRGIFINNGNYNLSLQNTFIEVGNNGGADTDAAFSVLEFRGKGNRSENDTFSRNINLSSISPEFISVGYVPEILGRGTHTQTVSNKGEIFFSGVGTLPAFRIPAFQSTKAIVDYTYIGQNGLYRTGKMHISFNLLTKTVEFTDDYDVIGIDVLTYENLKFYASYDLSSQTVTVRYTNTTNSDEIGAEFAYCISYQN